jgi:hypothetical protein
MLSEMDTTAPAGKSNMAEAMAQRISADAERVAQSESFVPAPVSRKSGDNQRSKDQVPVSDLLPGSVATQITGAHPEEISRSVVAGRTIRFVAVSLGRATFCVSAVSHGRKGLK